MKGREGGWALDGVQGGWRDEGRVGGVGNEMDGTGTYPTCSSSAETACLVLVLDVLLLVA